MTDTQDQDDADWAPSAEAKHLLRTLGRFVQNQEELLYIADYIVERKFDMDDQKEQTRSPWRGQPEQYNDASGDCANLGRLVPELRPSLEPHQPVGSRDPLEARHFPRSAKVRSHVTKRSSKARDFCGGFVGEVLRNADHRGWMKCLAAARKRESKALRIAGSHC